MSFPPASSLLAQARLLYWRARASFFQAASSFSLWALLTSVFWLGVPAVYGLWLAHPFLLHLFLLCFPHMSLDVFPTFFVFLLECYLFIVSGSVLAFGLFQLLRAFRRLRIDAEDRTELCADRLSRLSEARSLDDTLRRAPRGLGPKRL